MTIVRFEALRKFYLGLHLFLLLVQLWPKLVLLSILFCISWHKPVLSKDEIPCWLGLKSCKQRNNFYEVKNAPGPDIYNSTQVIGTSIANIAHLGETFSTRSHPNGRVHCFPDVSQ